MENQPVLRLRNCKCPSCGAKTDGATGVGTEIRIPREGDLTICIYCGEFGVYRLDDEADFYIDTVTMEEAIEAVPVPTMAVLLALKASIKQQNRETAGDSPFDPRETEG